MQAVISHNPRNPINHVLEFKNLRRHNTLSVGVAKNLYSNYMNQNDGIYINNDLKVRQSLQLCPFISYGAVYFYLSVETTLDSLR